MAELQKNCSSALALHLVGCKTDLDKNREVKSDEAKKYAQENQCEFIEVSAKTGSNINELFEDIATILWTKTKK